MNVLLIDHAPFFGGSESFLLDLVSVLNRNAFTPIIVTDPRSPVLERFRASDAPVMTTPLPHINRNPIFLLHLYRAGRHLAQVARDARADLLHTFTVRAHLIGTIASKLSGVPVLWRMCDDTLPGWAASVFGKMPTRIVAVSKYIASCYPNLHFDGFAPDGARPPASISRGEARAELGLPAHDLVIAHVGRLVRWKGQEIFIRGLARAAQTIPNLRGVVVGAWHKEDDQPGPLGGGELYYDELRALADQLDVLITFAGFLREPGFAYAAADIVAHTSTQPEPFGRTVIEAMMYGKPIIAANAGALPEIVIDGKTGILTQPCNPDAFANAVVRLATGQAREQIGIAARQRAHAEYTLDQMARRMESFYQMTTNKRMPPLVSDY